MGFGVAERIDRRVAANGIAPLGWFAVSQPPAR
jgi:hypothetical protein